MGAGELTIGQVKKQANGSFTGTLSRVYEGHTCKQVWRMLTEPQSMAQWLAAGTIEQKAGGQVKIDFVDSGILIDSQVLAIQPEELLSYSWSSGNEPQRPLSWQLTDVPDGVQLTLTASIPAGEDAAKAFAGFEGHLDMLAGALEGVPMKFPFQLFLQARTEYTAAIDKLGE